MQSAFRPPTNAEVNPIMPLKNNHGKRAAGMTSVTFPCSTALKRAMVELAGRDSRKLSAWVRIQLSVAVERMGSA